MGPGRHAASALSLALLVGVVAACGRSELDTPFQPQAPDGPSRVDASDVPGAVPIASHDATPSAVWTPPAGLETFQYRRRILVDNLGLTATLSDVPVLVRLTADSFDYSHAATDGRDLRFVDDAGNTLSWEIERWNDATTHDSEVWVRLPAVASSTSPKPIFWMYYGDPTAQSTADAPAVWQTFGGVWHLAGNTLSSATGGLAVTISGTASAEGRIAAGRRFNGTKGDTLSVNDANALDPQKITVSAWIFPTDWNGNRRVLQKGNSDNQYRLFRDSGGFHFDVKSVGDAVTTTLPTTNAWHHVAATYDKTAVRLYVDGALVASKAATANMPTTTDPLHIGAKVANGTDGDHFAGIIDQVTVSGVARTPEWITTEYRVGAGTLLSIGAEEQKP